MEQKTENTIEIQKFWNEIGSEKFFTDPFYFDKFSSYTNKNSSIIEYGCGYGRILQALWEKGYEQLLGFDFAPKMIEKGKHLFPYLDLQLIQDSGQIPLEEESTDAIILSTVLCCNPAKEEQEKIVNAIYRTLKKGGILYLCDFLITRSEKYLSRYREYIGSEDDFGVYRTREGVLVRHHSMSWIFHLLRQFDIMWLEQLDDVTMNGNPVRTVHLIAQKKLNNH